MRLVTVCKREKWKTPGTPFWVLLAIARHLVLPHTPNLRSTRHTNRAEEGVCEVWEAPKFRRILLDLDPETSIETHNERLNSSVSRPKFTADVLSTFSCFGVTLALIGVYGVLACRTRAQVREIVVRQALGATRSTLIADVLGHAVRIVLSGLLAGIAAAIAGNRLLTGVLF